MEDRKKIILSAFALSPYKGSEFAVAWNFIINISKEYDIFVLFGMSDNYMGDNQSMNKYLESNSISGVEFIEVRHSKAASFFVFLDKLGLGWFFYFALSLWQKKALSIAKRIAENNTISLTHQLGPIGFREPGFLWKLNIPHIWGPIGGTKKIDLKLLIDKPAIILLKFVIKNSINLFQLRFSNKVKKAIKTSNILLAATLSDKDNIQKFFNKKSHHFPENGILDTPFYTNKKFDDKKKCLHMVWCGRLTHEKNLVLALHALSKVIDKKWQLHVVGDGVLKKYLYDLANKLGVQQNIKWYGPLPRPEVLDIFSKSHLHIITSITEANSTVLFEAMSFGVPTLTIDHCGMGDLVDDKCGIKIKIDKFTKMVEAMANALNQVIGSTNYLDYITSGVRQASQAHTWENRMKALSRYYAEAMENI